MYVREVVPEAVECKYMAQYFIQRQIVVNTVMKLPIYWRRVVLDYLRSCEQLNKDCSEKFVSYIYHKKTEIVFFQHQFIQNRTAKVACNMSNSPALKQILQ